MSTLNWCPNRLKMSTVRIEHYRLVSSRLGSMCTVAMHHTLCLLFWVSFPVGDLHSEPVKVWYQIEMTPHYRMHGHAGHFPYNLSAWNYVPLKSVQGSSGHSAHTCILWWTCLLATAVVIKFVVKVKGTFDRYFYQGCIESRPFVPHHGKWLLMWTSFITYTKILN